MRRGLRFVGLDVIGDWLTEVNVTSPTLRARSSTRSSASTSPGTLFDRLRSDPMSDPVLTDAASGGDRLNVTLLFSIVAHSVLALG